MPAEKSQAVPGVGRADEASLVQGEQVIFAHQAQHAVVIGGDILTVKSCRDPPVAITRPIKRDAC